jgi:hypothetical protein
MTINYRNLLLVTILSSLILAIIVIKNDHEDVSLKNINNPVLIDDLRISELKTRIKEKKNHLTRGGTS